MFGALPLALALLPLLASAIPVHQHESKESLKKRSFSAGPLLPDNFADPSFIKVDSTYYAFSTNSGANVPVATSPDFINWTVMSGTDALPTVGAWSDGSNVWAPDVIQLGDGSFVLYYAAGSTTAGTHCVGAATSNSVTGPYTPVADALACPISQGGAIDISGFTDADGSIWTVYKTDGNNIGHGGNCNNGVAPIVATPIMLQPMQADGITLNGDPVQILDRGDADGPLVEAPSLARIADASSAGGWLYILFFSSNCYSGSLYDTSYAVSTAGVQGPYAKSAAPLLVTGSNDGALYSPGALTAANDMGLDSNVVFHADQGTTADVRQLWGGVINVDVGGRTVSM